MPKVSVIIPVYGVEKYIERCASSLFKQTLDDIEYIFVDDCTPDHSIEILESIIEEYRLRFAEEKKVVRIVRMPTNSGLPAVRRHGIQLATGDYIIHCDSDDWVDTQIYERLYKTAIDGDYDIVWCGYYKSDGTNHIPVSDNNQQELMTGPLWNKLIKRTLYDNDIVFPTANKAEDGALMVQLSYFSKSRYYIDEFLYFYYNNPSSICRVQTDEAYLSRFNQEISNTNLRLDFLKNNGIEKKYAYDAILWKLTTRDILLPLNNQKKYYHLWKTTYPELNRDIFKNSQVPLQIKISFLAKYLRMNNVVSIFKRKNS